jgi:uncharacterized protein (TIGR03435 family)
MMRMRTTVTVVTFATVISGVTVLSAQAPGAQPATPAFDVASVKRNTSNSDMATYSVQPSGRVTILNIPLRQLIVRAFQVQPFQIVDGPDWVDTENFDVNAVAPAGASPITVSAMLQTLLRDRFKLQTRRATRELPAFVLTLARTYGRLSAAVKPAAADCETDGRSRTDVTAAEGRQALPGLPPTLASGVISGCRWMRTPGWLMVAGQPMSSVATALTQQLGQFVVDRTGLQGNYDFSLSFMPENRGPQVSALPPEFPHVNADAPSLFTALREQLGLKLESGRVPVEVLVIDSIERPTPD